MEQNFQRKITPYLDGSLSPEERSEFEAFVAVHPEFEREIRLKEEEMSQIRSLIPAVILSASSLQSMDHEIKQSVFNLLKQGSESFWEEWKGRYAEWVNR